MFLAIDNEYQPDKEKEEKQSMLTGKQFYNWLICLIAKFDFNVFSWKDVQHF